MQKLLKLIILCTLLILFQFFIESQVFAQANNNASTSAPASLSGGATITTDYVWHGITQSRKNPALQSYLVYGFGPIFNMGLWGSSVSYDDNKSTMLLKLLMEVRIDFSQNFKWFIKFNDNHYFESGNRDGNTVGFTFNIFDYNVIIEKDSNWQKTEASATYFGFAKGFKVFTDSVWDNQIGYTMFSDQALNNYIDIRTDLGVPSGKLLWNFGMTWVNEASQFNGAADLQFYLSASAKF